MKKFCLVITAFFAIGLIEIAAAESHDSASSIGQSYPRGLNPRDMRKMARAKKKRKNNNSNSNSAPGLGSVCTSAVTLSGMLVKAEISDHINRGDPRASGYTLVCGQRCVEFVADFFYCDGTKAGSFGYYGRWNVTNRPRAYGAAGGAPQHSVSAIQATARRKKCGTTLFLRTQRKRSQCLAFSAFASRTGSPY
ncbi:MAG: hypothetical protein DCC75_10570 [Proteobacteria bacterium]|nr:MAG: hypothetical protein DCC75_10570 [Pseudomonadota bacterium]